jgi:trehalose utilization protein
VNDRPIQVTVWNEYVCERTYEEVRAVYPDGIHTALAQAMRDQLGTDAAVRTVTLDQPEHGLPEEVLGATDVLIWWAHAAHDHIADVLVDRVQQRVLRGMGLIALRSAQGARVLQRLIGTTCAVRWREAGERELVWSVNPSHPIAAGLPHPFIIPKQEMYGEFFDIPEPEELVFISSYTGVRCSGAAAVLPAAGGASSTSAPDTSRTRSTTSQRSSASWRMQRVGQQTAVPCGARSICRRIRRWAGLSPSRLQLCAG